MRNLGIIQPWACWDQVAHGYWGIHHESVTVNIVRLLFIWVQGSISVNIIVLLLYSCLSTCLMHQNLSIPTLAENIIILQNSGSPSFIIHFYHFVCILSCLYHESMIIIIYLITSFFIFCFLSHFFFSFTISSLNIMQHLSIIRRRGIYISNIACFPILFMYCFASYCSFNEINTV